ncbi:hypothetical protein Ppa06_57810 [Planomonospora parontospora subsp. parontospora]|uniref:Uncharacterized protein n=2 Tax=Planomonospora parontospora TaxID=58119 RepID=A0AA37F7M4_9ACTN|nr:hypothetical protein [Planomonospora parontospora]GGK90542.1 hypothetical protein GCM10010126_57500 [Planomonospora parontospora]GII11983.1 hypothetical protein Ppa06_57810 [Planomonospora parontospora subsp. parontospora]
MSNGKDAVRDLVEHAKQAGLTVKQTRNGKYQITNPNRPETRPVFLPPRAHSGPDLDNYRREIERLIDQPPPMVTAVTETDPEQLEAAGRNWPITLVMALAERYGVTWKVSGGVLFVTAPLGAESVAQVLRDREAEVVAQIRLEGEQPMSRAQPREAADDGGPTAAKTMSASAPAKTATPAVRVETEPETASASVTDIAELLATLQTVLQKIQQAEAERDAALQRASKADVKADALERELADAKKGREESEQLLVEADRELARLTGERDHYKGQLDALGGAFAALKGYTR